jgi:hypothetical protein
MENPSPCGEGFFVMAAIEVRYDLLHLGFLPGWFVKN